MKTFPSAAMICTFWLMYGSMVRYQTGRRRPATSSGPQLVRCGFAPAMVHASPGGAAVPSAEAETK